MDLPNDEIGISDILDYRECPQRFAFDMRRHVELPERFALFDGDKDEPPEHDSPASAYGSAIHDAIEVLEKAHCSNQEAIDAVWPIYQHWLEPADEDRLSADLDTYRTRSVTGYRLVGTELEMRMPLFVHEGRMIYFRGRIDVLYEHISQPGVFLSRDYKSSRWAKTEDEVHKDPQQWAYNMLVHYTYPECVSLTQIYDQLRYGEIPTRKNDNQRAQIKRWLIRQVKAILADTQLRPHQNDMCQFCPLVADCRETVRAVDFWINRLGVTAPLEKDGRKLVVRLATENVGFEDYTEMLPRAKQAVKHIEKYVEKVEGVLKEMPQDRREELGYDLTKPRNRDVFDPDALKRISDMTAEEFWHLLSISKRAVEDFYGKDSPMTQAIFDLASKRQGNPSLKAKRAA